MEGKQCQKTMFSLKIDQSLTSAPPLPLRNVLSRDDSENCPEVAEKEYFENAPEKNDVDNGCQRSNDRRNRGSIIRRMDENE